MPVPSKLDEFIATKTSADPIGPARRCTWATTKCSRAGSPRRTCVSR